MDWYFGAIDRKEAERVLLKCTVDSFLVRKSSIKGSYALSMYDAKKRTVTHTLIEPRDGGFAFQVYCVVTQELTRCARIIPVCIPP